MDGHWCRGLPCPIWGAPSSWSTHRREEDTEVIALAGPPHLIKCFFFEKKKTAYRCRDGPMFHSLHVVIGLAGGWIQQDVQAVLGKWLCLIVCKQESYSSLVVTTFSNLSSCEMNGDWCVRAEKLGAISHWLMHIYTDVLGIVHFRA